MVYQHWKNHSTEECLGFPFPPQSLMMPWQGWEDKFLKTSFGMMSLQSPFPPEPMRMVDQKWKNTFTKPPFPVHCLGMVHQCWKNNSPKISHADWRNNQSTMFVLPISFQPPLLLLPVAVDLYQAVIVLIPSIDVDGFVFPWNELYGHIRRKADLGRWQARFAGGE